MPDHQVAIIGDSTATSHGLRGWWRFSTHWQWHNMLATQANSLLVRIIRRVGKDKQKITDVFLTVETNLRSQVERY